MIEDSAMSGLVPVRRRFRVAGASAALLAIAQEFTPSLGVVLDGLGPETEGLGVEEEAAVAAHVGRDARRRLDALALRIAAAEKAVYRARPAPSPDQAPGGARALVGGNAEVVLRARDLFDDPAGLFGYEIMVPEEPEGPAPGTLEVEQDGTGPVLRFRPDFRGAAAGTREVQVVAVNADQPAAVTVLLQELPPPAPLLNPDPPGWAAEDATGGYGPGGWSLDAAALFVDTTGDGLDLSVQVLGTPRVTPDAAIDPDDQRTLRVGQTYADETVALRVTAQNRWGVTAAKDVEVDMAPAPVPAVRDAALLPPALDSPDPPLPLPGHGDAAARDFDLLAAFRDADGFEVVDGGMGGAYRVEAGDDGRPRLRLVPDYRGAAPHTLVLRATNAWADLGGAAEFAFRVREEEPPVPAFDADALAGALLLGALDEDAYGALHPLLPQPLAAYVDDGGTGEPPLFAASAPAQVDAATGELLYAHTFQGRAVAVTLEASNRWGGTAQVVVDVQEPAPPVPQVASGAGDEITVSLGAGGDAALDMDLVFPPDPSQTLSLTLPSDPAWALLEGTTLRLTSPGDGVVTATLAVAAENQFGGSIVQVLALRFE